jgi:putative spermidine/putrescine transport system substrate-binding protein
MSVRLGRREFLALTGVAGLGALAACAPSAQPSSGTSGSSAGTTSPAGTGTSSAGSSSTGSAGGAGSSSAPAKTGGKIVAGEWGGVWDKALGVVTPPFTQRTGIEVMNTVTTGGQLTVIQQNPGKYDLSWLIGSDAANGLAQGVLDPIDKSKITAIDSIIPNLISGQTFGGKLAGVPISYGAEGILWRKDKVPFEITSWADLWRPELKGQIAIQNAPSIGGLFLVYAAGQAFGSGPDDFTAGWTAVAKLRDNVQYLYTVSSDPINKLADGSVWVAVTFANQGIPLKGQNVEVTIPKEGAPWSVQNITVPSASKNKDLTYQFINYMLESDSQIAWAKNAKAAPANTAVTLPTDVQGAIMETPEVASKLWPINWQELGQNIPGWTTQWQKIFSS